MKKRQTKIITMPQHFKDLKHKIIEEALLFQSRNGVVNISKLAKLLGVSYGFCYKIIKEYNNEVEYNNSKPL